MGQIAKRAGAAHVATVKDICTDGLASTGVVKDVIPTGVVTKYAEDIGCLSEYQTSSVEIDYILRRKYAAVPIPAVERPSEVVDDTIIDQQKKVMFESFFTRNKLRLNKLWEIESVTFNPVENYDRIEAWTDTRSGSESSTTQYKGKESNKHTENERADVHVTGRSSQSNTSTTEHGAQSTTTTAEHGAQSTTATAEHGAQSSTLTDSSTSELARATKTIVEDAGTVKNASEGTTSDITTNSGTDSVNTNQTSKINQTKKTTQTPTAYDTNLVNAAEESYSGDADTTTGTQSTAHGLKVVKDTDTTTTATQTLDTTHTTTNSGTDTTTNSGTHTTAANKYTDTTTTADAEYTDTTTAAAAKYTDITTDKIGGWTDESRTTYAPVLEQDEKSYTDREDSQDHTYNNVTDAHDGRVHGNVGATKSTELLNDFVECYVNYAFWEKFWMLFIRQEGSAIYDTDAEMYADIYG